MKKITTLVVDDIDGSPGAEAHQLAIDGYTIEIDLADGNRSKLYAFLRPYLDAGRRIPGSKRQPVAPTTPASRSEIRLWWKKHPKGLPTWQARGAIPTVVSAAWQTQRGSQ